MHATFRLDRDTTLTLGDSWRHPGGARLTVKHEGSYFHEGARSPFTLDLAHELDLPNLLALASALVRAAHGDEVGATPPRLLVASVVGGVAVAFALPLTVEGTPASGMSDTPVVRVTLTRNMALTVGLTLAKVVDRERALAVEREKAAEHLKAVEEALPSEEPSTLAVALLNGPVGSEDAYTPEGQESPEEADMEPHEANGNE